MYTRIYRITTEGARFDSIVRVFEELDSLGEPFDVYLLSHGMPNHLSTGEGYFLSYRELNMLHFKNLNLVFLQSCFGSSLAQDWLRAGARSVMSFDGLNRNFFWISFFLRWYRYFDVAESYNKTNHNLDFALNNEILYLKLLEGLGITPAEYLANSPNPTLSVSSYRPW
jgi:hypothetical protein